MLLQSRAAQVLRLMEADLSDGPLVKDDLALVVAGIRQCLAGRRPLLLLVVVGDVFHVGRLVRLLVGGGGGGGGGGGVGGGGGGGRGGRGRPLVVRPDVLVEVVRPGELFAALGAHEALFPGVGAPGRVGGGGKIDFEISVKS